MHLFTKGQNFRRLLKGVSTDLIIIARSTSVKPSTLSDPALDFSAAYSPVYQIVIESQEIAENIKY